jgi:hypothetical protein
MLARDLGARERACGTNQTLRLGQVQREVPKVTPPSPTLTPGQYAP